MRRISCLLGTLALAACSSGADPAQAVGVATSSLLEAPFAIGDTVAGPTRNSEEGPSVVAGNGDFGAMWFEPDKGYAFARMELVDGRLQTVVRTYPITPELFTSWSEEWYTPTLFFDGTHYRIRYQYRHTDTSFERRILTLDAQGLTIGESREAPALSEHIACLPSGVCLLAQPDSTFEGRRVQYSLLEPDGSFLPVATLAAEPKTFIHGIQVAPHGESFALVVSAVHQDTIPYTRTLSLWTITAEGEAEGPKVLTTTERIDSFDVTSHDGQLLAVYAAGPALTSVRVDGLGGVTTRLLTEQPWRVEAPLTVKSVGSGFLVSFHLAYVNDVSARVMAFSGDGTPDEAGSLALSSPTVGKMVNPTLASDGEHAVVLANGNEAYQHGLPPYLSDDYPRISVYGQSLGGRGEGADELARVAHGQAAQFHPSVSWNGKSFTTAWVDNRAGWERLQLRGATVSGEAASVFALAPSVRSAALTGVHSATLGDHTLFAWHERTYDVDEPGAGSYLDRDRVRAVLTDASGAAANDIIELASDAAVTGGARVATDGEGYLVAWYDGTYQRVMAAAVTAEGERAGDPLLVANAHLPDHARPALAFTGSAYLLAWVPSPHQVGDTRHMGAALVQDGKVTPLSLPDAYSTRTIDAGCGPAGCMLVRDDGDDGIYTLRVDASGVAQGEWTRTPGKALNHPRVAFTGHSFLLTALDVTGDELFGLGARIHGAYMLEYALDGSVGADFMPLDIQTAGPVEVASDGHGKSLLVFPSDETGRIEGLSLDPFAMPGDDDAGTGPNADAGDGEPVGPGDGDGDTGSDAGTGDGDGATPSGPDGDGDPSDAEGNGAAKPDSGCDVRAGGSNRVGLLALLLVACATLALRRRPRASFWH